MKAAKLSHWGVPHGQPMKEALKAAIAARQEGASEQDVRTAITAVLSNPADYQADPQYADLAAALIRHGAQEPTYKLNEDLRYRTWGEGIEAGAHAQMQNACRLPVSVAGALMPDAHQGYGLPIGGVLATEGAVIPYAVGVDIACRMMLTVFDQPAENIVKDDHRLSEILEKNTRFGVGAAWKRPKNHPCMDEDWSVSSVTKRMKDTAHSQLGTSGSGNHFVEFGELELYEELDGKPPGKYLAVVSHSGSRGTGANVCSYYSKLAQQLHPDLPGELKYLAWLPMTGDGAEYWAAMELMGKYASGNHHIIHRDIAREVGGDVLFQIENHHNFAWKEKHGGRNVIVHRKGATPAGKGVRGYIPGSMTAPGFLVEGLGHPESLDSASHGAGRQMSRKAATEKFNWHFVKEKLSESGVKLLSAGLDEAPGAYKDIHSVMSAQSDLVRVLAKFQPRIVKMAPAGERPED